MRQVRRIDLLWEGDDIEIYERLKQRAINVEKELPEFVKEMIEREIERNGDG
jgi:predicted DNA-binding protein